MFLCYELTNDGLRNGFDADAFGCIVADPGTTRVEACDMQFIPVMDGIPTDNSIRAQLSLAFVHPVLPVEDELFGGAVVAVDLSCWNMARGNTQLMLLDTSTRSSTMALVFVPPRQESVFMRSSKTATEVLSTDAAGKPSVGLMLQGNIMAGALGLDVRTLFPARLQEIHVDAPTASAASTGNAPAEASKRPSRKRRTGNKSV